MPLDGFVYGEIWLGGGAEMSSTDEVILPAGGNQVLAEIAISQLRFGAGGGHVDSGINEVLFYDFDGQPRSTSFSDAFYNMPPQMYAERMTSVTFEVHTINGWGKGAYRVWLFNYHS